MPAVNVGFTDLYPTTLKQKVHCHYSLLLRIYSALATLSHFVIKTSISIQTDQIKFLAILYSYELKLLKCYLR